MKEKITLPNNAFGVVLMLSLIVLTFIVPFVLTLWALNFIAPLWVSLPVAFLVAIVTFARLVKFPKDKA
jgi:membrane protein YdbS with pleckstrin-like domain